MRVASMATAINENNARDEASSPSGDHPESRELQSHRVNRWDCTDTSAFGYHADQHRREAQGVAH